MSAPPNNGTGFVSLADYIGANQDPLDAQYNTDAAYANGLDQSFNGTLGFVPGEAERVGQNRGLPVGGTAGALLPYGGNGSGQDPYTNATGAASKASDLAQEYKSPAGLQAALSGDGSAVNPADSFNASLLSGAHGQDYATLGAMLGNDTQARVDSAWKSGLAKGVSEYVPPGSQPAPPPDTSVGNDGPDRPYHGDGGGGRLPYAPGVWNWED